VSPTTSGGGAERRHDAFSLALGKQVEFAIVDRFAMPPGIRRPGPLIIVEPTATTYVDADFDTEIDAAGCLHLYHRGA
jgi:N-methylhydantoinase A